MKTLFKVISVFEVIAAIACVVLAVGFMILVIKI